MLSPEEQLDIGRRLREGDRDAWAALYEHYNIAVWRLTARLVGPDAAGVADVVQEVFLGQRVQHDDLMRSKARCGAG